MTLGSLARRILGDRFPDAGRFYRSLFVDLEKVAETFPVVPPGAHILDVGGGDGEVINALLRRFPEARVTMIDRAPAIGGNLRPDLRERVHLLPGTTVDDYRSRGLEPPDFVLVSDVVHHIAPSDRVGFLTEIHELVLGRPTKLIIKDFEPGSFRAMLGYLSDLYISGDKKVRFVDRKEMTGLVREVFGPIPVEETALFALDPPNYSLVFSTGTS